MKKLVFPVPDVCFLPFGSKEGNSAQAQIAETAIAERVLKESAKKIIRKL